MAEITLDEYIRKFEAHLSHYLPSGSNWTPVELALTQPLDMFRVPLNEAEVLQLAAIRHSFMLHYSHNATYRHYCLEHGITPEDIRSSEDLEKIPLISDRFYKEHPTGKDFATWIGNIFTGNLPQIIIHHNELSFEQVIQAFNQAGLVITYSSGTSGLQTVIPRDRYTFNLAKYSIARALLTMFYPFWDYHMSGYLMMPNPRKTNVFAGKVCEALFDTIEDVSVAIDRVLPAHVVRMTMSGEKGLKAGYLRLIMRLSSIHMITQIIRWLNFHQKTDRKIAMMGSPYIIWLVMNRLRKEGKSFDFGERIEILTGGGWKVYEGYRLPAADFRQQALEIFGALPEHCLDIYGMVEGNGWMVQCPEGHYLHVPYTYYKGMVVDEHNKPLSYGERGRFAFLDASAISYPGFIVTGDIVRMLEHCPVCDRPGPVLDPEIQRASGEDMRGCGEEVRRMVSIDAGGYDGSQGKLS